MGKLFPRRGVCARSSADSCSMFKVHEITPNAHSQDIWSCAWGGNVIATGSLDQSVKLWRFDQSKEPQTLRGHNFAVVSVDVSKGGQLMASSGLDSQVVLYDGASGKPVHSIVSKPGECYAVRFSPD